MGLAGWFSTFCGNIQVRNRPTISGRYRNITKRLNTDFWSTTSDSAHSLYVGSYGRRTAIQGTSDVGMIFRLPDSVYRQSAADLWLIREKYLALITDLRVSDDPIENIRLRRDALLKQLHTVYSGAPSTTVRAYTEAQKALQQWEEMTFSDEEIDKLLPRQLQSALSRPDGSDQGPSV